MAQRKQVAILALAALALGLAMAPQAKAEDGDGAAVLVAADHQVTVHAPAAPPEDVVIRNGKGIGPVLYEVRDGRAYAGNAATADALFTARFGSIYVGTEPSGEVAFTIKGDCLREARRGTCVLHERDGNVIEWRTGKTIYEFHGDRLFDGRGNAMLQADLDLEDANDATKWMIVTLLESQVR